VTYYTDPLVTLHVGDCLEVLPTLEADSVDAVVTDPPYGLEFMGKEWDGPKLWNTSANGQQGRINGKGGMDTFGQRPVYKAGPAFQAWCEQWGREALRVTKPGGYLLAFGGTRTHHRLVCALEDAGWIIRDELDWIYASGFPKGKANLKPAHEPIVLARKPGPLRPLAIDATRIGMAGVGYVQPRDTNDEGGASWSKGAHRPFHYADSVRRPTATLGAWDDEQSLCGSCAVDVANRGRPGTPATRASTTPKPAELWPSEPATSGDTSRADIGCSDGTTLADIGTSSSIAESGSKPTGLSPQDASSITSTATSSTTGLRTCRSCGATSTATTITDDTTSTPSDPSSETTFDDPVRGRWPSNVVLSDPDLFDQPNPYVVGSGATSVAGFVPEDQPRGRRPGGFGDVGADKGNGVPAGPQYGDSGGYSRFFAIPTRYNRTCVRCGVTIASGSSRDGMTPDTRSDSADGSASPIGSDGTAPSAPSAATSSSTPTTPTAPPSAPTSDGEASGSRSEPSSTSETERSFWSDDAESTPPTPRSKRRGTSPVSTPPSSPAKSPDAASPETDTTTTTPDRWMCGTCVEAITSSTTSDSDGLPEPYPRYLIIPKADRAERERGLGDRERGQRRTMGGGLTGVSGDRSGRGGEAKPIEAGAALRANVHPTVKPIDLMRHLVRLVTPPGGVVLDPFLGSGTTCLAASEEGFRSIGIERELEYLEIAKGRLMATPMGLGLDHGLTGKAPPKTHPDLSKHQPKRRAAGENYSGGWAGTDEEPAA
jgi:DNA modification methylase